MLKNYLKIAFRAFAKRKLTSTINIIGLSIGIASAGLGFVFIRHELSYDRFHDEAEQIFWLSAAVENKINIASTPGPLAPQLRENFPEVTEALRLEQHELLIQSGNEYFKENAHFVDPNFFSFFSFDLLEGDPASVLMAPNALVLSAAMAHKYFGRLSPVGKSLKLSYQGKEVLFTVSGVAADPPGNSSLQFRLLLPLQFLYQEQPDNLASAWNSFPVTSFIRLRAGSDIGQLKQSLPDFVAGALPDDLFGDEKLIFQVRSLQDYHLRDQYLANGLTAPADMTYVRIMGIIATLILLVACLNFMNLANAQGSGRLLEVGVRRVLGAGRRQLIGQFLSEAVVTSLLALCSGILLINLSLPFIAQITGFPLEINWMSIQVILPLLGIAILTGLVAGFYPSVLLSRLQAAQTFRSDLKTGGNNLVTRGSLIFQFAISIGLLSCTFIMYQQQQFIRDHHLGFDQETTVVIPTQFGYKEAEASQRLVSQYKNEIAELPGVQRVSGVSNSFDRGNSAVFIKQEDGSQLPVFFYSVDSDYLPLLNIELVQGSNFSAGTTPGASQAVIVNEAFLRQFNIMDPDTYLLPEEFRDFANAHILGVVKDYNYMNLKTDIQPLILRQKQDALLGHMLVKISPREVDATLAALKAGWQKVNPAKPFEFSFLDEDVQRQYLIESRWNKAISGAAVLAILIACLGLFGLIALILAERTKEIGIRKILGASIGEISWLISRQFILLLVIAAMLAIPAAWWAMQRWLEDFAYKIDLQVVVFVAALGVTLVIALLTMGLQSAKAAMQNPAEALRNE